MTRLEFRPAIVADLPEAVTLRALMLGELNGKSPDEEYPGWRDRFALFYRQRMDDAAAAVFMACAETQPVGISTVYKLANHRSAILGLQSAYVSSVYVRPEWRKQGVASRLTRMTIDWAKAAGCSVIRLRPSAMARGVYARLGFRQSDEMELPLSN